MRLLINISRTLVSWGQKNIDLVSFIMLLYAVKRHKFLNKNDLVQKILKQINLGKLTIPGLDNIPVECIVLLCKILTRASLCYIAIAIHKQRALGSMLSLLE